MIDSIIKKHVTLRAAPAMKTPEQRALGDRTGGGRDAISPPEGGDGLRDDGAPADQDPFLRGVVQWKNELPSKDHAPPLPSRDRGVHS
jgi:hypothetical protein